ncbi:MAG: sodium/solute symporter [Phycisphaerae bacterium]|nr:sodium/solute symporter [Phycisphaerae bacterium]
MPGTESFALDTLDYIAFAAYFVVLCAIGLWAGRKEKTQSDEYFLAGRTLPWYVVGSSFVASNISTEHFIGMIGAAFIYGICVATSEWGNVLSFSVLIWFFIPFLLASRVFTTPEFMEKRFNPVLRQFFALVTVVSNVVAFLAAVLYGGGLALQSLFREELDKIVTRLGTWAGYDALSADQLAGGGLWFAIVVLAVVAGAWAIYGGLKSVAWTDFFTIIVMVVGGLMVTILGLYMLSGESHSLVEGWRVMIERNRADGGVWQEVVLKNAQHCARVDAYDRLSVIQPATHETHPWPSLILGLVSVSIWYNVINQFMIQRVLGAKNMYHARMGIVLAGYLKILMPAIVVIPGLILFARYPEVMKLPWDEIKPEADKGYVHMLQMLIPVGLRGLFLAALFGAIQSTVNSVLNSTATIFTLDIYKRLLNPQATEKHFVRMGMWSSVVILGIAIVLARYIGELGGSLFVYIQTLYAFFAPPFSAVFILGILWRRINGAGALTAVCVGFVFGIAMKVYVQVDPNHIAWIEPYSMQAIVNWAFCTVICIVVSLLTAPPRPEQVTDQLTFNWHKLNIFGGLGERWYTSVVFWWAIFVVIIASLMVTFSGLVL